MRTWKNFTLGAVIAVTAVITGCGGGGNGGTPTPNSLGATITPIADIPVTGITAGTNFSFDIGQVDNPTGSVYGVTDRNNKSVDLFNTTTLTLAKLVTGGFAGNGPTISTSGPDGLMHVPVANNPRGHALFYAGDIDKVMIVDLVTQTVVKTFALPNPSGKRADEGCLDTVNNILAISTPEGTIAGDPYVTFINTMTETVLGQYRLPGGGANGPGIEQCRYDPVKLGFWFNNDGTVANGHGELDFIPSASVPAAGVITIFPAGGGLAFSEGNCDPTGMAIGPANDIAIGCRPATFGAPLIVQIMDRTTGAILASPLGGGGDQMEYDPVSNKYYVAANRWSGSGTSVVACSAAFPCQPKLNVINAATRSVFKQISMGNNAHSVAVDNAHGHVFVPYSSATSPAGCSDCTANGFINGGVSVFNTQ